jgi:hypothetical protein
VENRGDGFDGGKEALKSGGLKYKLSLSGYAIACSGLSRADRLTHQRNIYQVGAPLMPDDDET